MRVKLLVLILSAISTPSWALRVVIDKPSPCHVVERTEGADVYLRSSERRDCPDVPGREGIDTEAGTERLNIYVDGVFWRDEDARPETAVDRLQELESTAAATKIKRPVISEGARVAAEGMKRKADSPEFKNRLLAEKNAFVQKTTGNKNPLPEAGNHPPSRGSSPALLAADERVYLFISSSMPENAVRNYLADAAKLGDPRVLVLLRGMVGKSIYETAAYNSRLARKDPSCDSSREKCETYRLNLMIDPLLFRKYQITEVPAVVYAKGVRVADAGMSEGKDGNAEVAAWHVVRGDASLGFVLDRINGAAKSPALVRMVEKLR